MKPSRIDPPWAPTEPAGAGPAPPRQAGGPGSAPGSGSAPVPRRLRFVFRLAFVALLAATLALALSVLHDEKRRSHRAYAEGLRKSEAQIAARLRHPTGQLMLLNAAAADLPATPLVPLVLPFGAIDFDDRAKAQQAVELAGCGVVYGDGASLCAGIGSNPFAGAFVYVVGQVPVHTLVPYRPGQTELTQAHRAWVEVRLADGESWRWIAPYQAQGEAGGPSGAATPLPQRGRLVAYDADAEFSTDSRPARDVRGWMWQEGACIGEPAAGALASLPGSSGPAGGAAGATGAGQAASGAPSLASPIAAGAAGANLPSTAAASAEDGAASAAAAASPSARAGAAGVANAPNAAHAASAANANPVNAAHAASAGGAASAAGAVSAHEPLPVAGTEPAAAAPDCLRRTYVSLRVPVPPWREALEAQRGAAWPPPRLTGTQVRLQLFGPGDDRVLFDSDNPGRSGTAAASAPFALAEFRRLLLPGETLRVQREGSEGVILEARGADTPAVAPREPLADDEVVPLPWIDALIRWLPVPGYDLPLEQRSIIATRLGNYRLTLLGDLRSVNRQLAGVATRLAGYVGAMLGAVLVVWLLLEVVVMRRIVLLTRRAAAVSDGMRTAPGARPGRLDLNVGGLSHRDELGVLAQGLRDLLVRVDADVERERIRARQEREQWHAVGHEILSPLQSLIVLHGDAADPASRYLRRMQQAVRVLYGQASPSEAFESTQLTLAPLDLDAFAAMVAGNAAHIGIADVRYRGPRAPAWVHADEHSLEDVLTHVLRNAERHREPGTPITLLLTSRGGAQGGLRGGEWLLSVHNRGPAIPEAMLERIFEYGVSGAVHAADEERAGAQRGQGLFVARTYMAKMGGTIHASNEDAGVLFTLALPKAPAPAEA